MNTLRVTVAGLLLIGLGTGIRAEEKKADNAKLIVGKWEATKADPGTVPVGALIEFTKEGKMIVSSGDMKLEGTYKVEGDKFGFALKMGDTERKKTITIKKLDDKEMVTEDEMKKGVTFTRQK